MLNKKMIELMERNIKYIYYSYVISIVYINRVYQSFKSIIY